MHPSRAEQIMRRLQLKTCSHSRQVMRINILWKYRRIPRHEATAEPNSTTIHFYKLYDNIFLILISYVENLKLQSKRFVKLNYLCGFLRIIQENFLKCEGFGLKF